MMGQRDVAGAESFGDPVEEVMPIKTGTLLKVTLAAVQFFRLLDHQFDPQIFAQATYKGLVAIGLGAAQAVVQMGSDRFVDHTGGFQSHQPVKQCDRIWATGKPDYDFGLGSNAIAQERSG